MLARIDERATPEQSPEYYGVRKGLTLREEISTAFRVGQSHFDAFNKLSDPFVDATRRFMGAFLKETFGFDYIEDDAGLLALSAGCTNNAEGCEDQAFAARAPGQDQQPEGTCMMA